MNKKLYFLVPYDVTTKPAFGSFTTREAAEEYLKIHGTVLGAYYVCQNNGEMWTVEATQICKNK